MLWEDFSRTLSISRLHDCKIGSMCPPALWETVLSYHFIAVFLFHILSHPPCWHFVLDCHPPAMNAINQTWGVEWQMTSLRIDSRWVLFPCMSTDKTSIQAVRESCIDRRRLLFFEHICLYGLPPSIFFPPGPVGEKGLVTSSLISSLRSSIFDTRCVTGTFSDTFHYSRHCSGRQQQSNNDCACAVFVIDHITAN